MESLPHVSPFVHPLHDSEIDGPPIIFDQGPFPAVYLYGIDESAIPSDADHDEWHALFSPTEADRADYRQLLAEDEPEWHTLDDEASEVCEPVANLVDALQAIAEHYESLEGCEVAVLVAEALREKVSEGRFLGSPTSLDVWADREAVARGWAG